MKNSRVCGLIPARMGSKRVPGKNIRSLQGHPMIAYSIASAIQSGVFARVIVSTDSAEIAALARSYGAEVPFLRPPEFAADQSPDIEWIQYTLKRLASEGDGCEAFSILRPTSPFRSAAAINRAWDLFLSVEDADSLRAVELCKQHPAKMWVVDGKLMKPLLNDGGRNPPWHSSAYQSLPPVYAQNASLEIAWSRVPLETGTIAGTHVIPFVTKGYEGFDINQNEDWLLAELLISQDLATLPKINP